MIDFKNISYLKTGNNKQRKAFEAITGIKLFENLKAFTPVLTGTIPIEIDIEDSDLDIVCYSEKLNQFKESVALNYGNYDSFDIQQKIIRNHQTIVARFYHKDFLFELFCQSRPIEKQEAYRHMLIEYKFLLEKGENFKREIIKLKKQGYKTEPAFARILGLKGDPYDELLRFE